MANTEAVTPGPGAPAWPGPDRDGWRPVTERFAEAASARPGQAAFIGPDGELTYAELDRRSAAVAAALGRLGLARDCVVGSALPGIRVRVLDARLRSAAPGVPGNLYIGGTGVARGYRGRPELTAERFLPDPDADPGARMYHTGDRARWLPDGGLEYLGRCDGQVKIRGYRVELGEIENVLGRCAGVAEAIVLPRDVAGDPCLVAWYRAAGQVTTAEVREALRRELPGYMIPAVLIAVDSLPVNANGKLDRAALAASALPHERDLAAGDFVPPWSPTERLLAGIWAEVLGADPVSADDSFFELGGQSVLAIRVAARLRRAGLNVPLTALFGKPRLRELAAHIDQAAESPAAGSGTEELVPVASG